MHRNIIEEEATARINEEIKAKEKVQRHSKMIKYAEVVKMTYKPKVSQQKRKQMELIMKKLEGTKPRQPVEVVYTNTRSKSSRRHTNMSRISKSTKRRSMHQSARPGSEESSDEVVERITYSTKKTKVDWSKFKNPMIPKKKVKPPPIVDDYLIKKRLMRDRIDKELEDFGLKKKNFSHNWQDITKDEVTDPEK